jgi:hypothetical protein
VPIPLWQIVLAGRAANGEAVRYVLDIRLPADPPAPPVVTATSIPAINLTPPRAPAATQGSSTPAPR